MLNNSAIKSADIRVYAQLIASIIKSSYFGLIIYFATLLFSKKTYLRVNNVFLGLVIIGLVMMQAIPLILENSLSSISYVRTIILWMLPIIYYATGCRDLNNHLYERLLIIMLIYTVIEFILINFTGISLFESDRSRGSRIFGLIRSEGVTNSSSMSAALVVSIFLKIYLKKGFSKKFFLTTLMSVVLLSSGAGILLFIFAVWFFIFNARITLPLSVVFLIIASLSISQFPAIMEMLGNIHPKISYQYISLIIDLKYEQISYLFNTDLQYILFGFSVLDNRVLSSGDFGYLTMIFALGLVPALILLFGIFMMFIRASRIGNFGPFLILMIATIHYPVFVDPISAYVLAQYAMMKRSER